MLDIFEIWDVGKVQFCEQVFRDQALDHVVRRDEQVDLGAFRGADGVHFLVRGRGRVVDFDVRVLILKFLDEVRVKVFTPVQDI